MEAGDINLDFQIHLIRHGKTLANEKKLYCGQTDLPLSENGAAEITALKDRGIYPGCRGEQDAQHPTSPGCPLSTLFFTSGLLRTEQTLDILFGQVPRKAVDGISEYHFGTFEMKGYEELKERPDYQAWITDDTGDISCPGGESKNLFEKRILVNYNIIVNLLHSDVFIICHGGAIACIMAHLFPNKQHFYGWQPEPGRGYTLVHVSGQIHTYKKI